MNNRFVKVVVSGLILLAMAPFFILGALLTILVAGMVGAPLTAPTPPSLFRKRNLPPQPPAYITRNVAGAAQSLLDSVSISAR